MSGRPLLSELLDAFESAPIDWRAWALAWARCAPVVAMVPAFGLRALPWPVRAGIALALAAVVIPTVGPAPNDSARFGVALVWEAARGIPIALAAAVPLWAATMAGGLVDHLRGGQESMDVPVVDSPAGPVGVMWSLLASALFLNLGGPARVVGALLRPHEWPRDPLLRAIADLNAGIQIAVAIAGPLAAAAVVLELAGALIARATSPAHVGAVLAGLRSVALLAMAGLLLDRIARLIAVAIRTGIGP